MKRLLIITGLLTVILTGCQKQDDVSDTPTPDPAVNYVLADLALSLPPSSAGTRMDQRVTEGGSGSSFRGISQLSIIPFSKRGSIEKTDKSSNIEISGEVPDFTNISSHEWYRYYNKVYLNLGVASFLTYGKGSQTSPAKPNDVSAKAFYGSLVPTLAGKPQDKVPDRTHVIAGDLGFELETIYNKTDAEGNLIVPSEATAIAGYLSFIADTNIKPGATVIYWKNAANSTYDGQNNLAVLYSSFISDQGGSKFGVIAGSAANVKAYVNEFYNKLEILKTNFVEGSPAKLLADKIQENIRTYNTASLKVTFDEEDKKVTSLGYCDNYPADKDLPDGAAVLQWAKKSDNNFGFVPQIQTTTMANVSSMNRYTYPAELYYFGNSQIKTSNTEVPVSAYSGTGISNWSDVVTNLYTSGTVVSSNTKAVAIVNPMQYAVARVQGRVQVTPATADNLPDANNASVPLTNEGNNSFKITGLIISRQFPVNYDFTPKLDGPSEDNERFVYDRYLRYLTNDPDNPIAPLYLTTDPTPDFYTMVLQSHDNEDVTVIMELENNSGKDFQGENGVVYNGTKFYLAGKVVLSIGDATGVDDDAKNRVFTQDHTTIIGMKVNSLAKAYNVMPNIQSGRLEVGVEITLKWEQATPQTIIFGEE